MEGRYEFESGTKNVQEATRPLEDINSIVLEDTKRGFCASDLNLVVLTTGTLISKYYYYYYYKISSKNETWHAKKWSRITNAVRGRNVGTITNKILADCLMTFFSSDHQWTSRRTNKRRQL